MSWTKIDKDVQAYCQDDISVAIIKTGYAEVYQNGSHQKMASFHVVYEDAYGDTGHSVLTAQEIKDQYGIDVTTETPDETIVLGSIVFTASVFYNDGLGDKIHPLPNITAKSPEEAQAQAAIEANKLIGEKKWLEVSVRPAGLTAE